MKKQLRNILLSIALIFLVLFILFVINQTASLVLIAKEYNPYFGSILLYGLLLLYAAEDLPKFADPESPPNVHVSSAYITDSFQETNTPNIVTSVLMDYRAFDTLMETAVIFTAGIACALLLRRNGE